MKKVKKPKITAKQINGNDGYYWAILVNGRPAIEGLTRSEVPYYRKRIEELEKEKLIQSHNSTHHNNLFHMECPLCERENPEFKEKQK